MKDDEKKLLGLGELKIVFDSSDDLPNDNGEHIYKQRNGYDNTMTSKESVTGDKENKRAPPLLDETLLYGWLWFSGKLMQTFNTPRYFLVWLCVSGAAQGLVRTGITFTVLTSIERQFGFKSSQVAFFSVVYDITYGICSIFVGYVGHKHKPRFIAWGCFIMALGAVTNSVPKFLIGPYVAGMEQSRDFCRNIGNGTSLLDTQCDGGSQEWYYQLLFILGSILFGIGATPLYTLAPAHLDEVTSRGQGSIYMGIFYAFSAVGPALGFMIGKPVLNTYVDLVLPSNSTLVPSDSNWVGAWWLGYLIGAVFLIIPVIPMLGFPSKFPNTDILRHDKLKLEDTVEENKDLRHDLQSVWPAVKVLMKNASFICVSVAIAAEGLATSGFATFLPKFVETQFYFTASNSALYTGIIVIPGAAGGILCGGYLAKRFQWNCKQLLKFSSIMAFIAAVSTLILLVGCESRSVVGEKWNGTSLMVSSCNSGCHCSAEVYKPICSVLDQKTYYSPCYAGCSKQHSSLNTYHNCTCLEMSNSHAVNGACTTECTLIPFFALGGLLLMFATFLTNVPMLNASLRVVPDGQGSFSMGFQQVIIRCLGFIPAPIIFGHVIDKSCKLWKKDSCTGKTTSCLEYDHVQFRYYMFALTVTCKMVCVVFIIISRAFYQLPVKATSEDDGNLCPTQNTSDVSIATGDQLGTDEAAV